MKLSSSRALKLVEVQNNDRTTGQSPISLERNLALPEEKDPEGGLDLRQVVEVIQRRIPIILGVTAIVLCGAIAWTRTRPPVYEGSFKILIEPVTAESQVVSSLEGQSTNVTSQDIGNTQASDHSLDYPTQIEVLESPKLLLPIVREVKSVYPGFSYDDLSSALKIERLKELGETKILTISYQSKLSKEAEKVVQLLSQTYIHYSINERKTNVRRAILFLDEQLPTIKKQVYDLESALQRFREQHRLVDTATLGTQIGGQISNIQQQQLETQLALLQTRQLYNSLEKQLQLQPKGAEAATVLSDAPGYQQLARQLQDLDVEIQTQSTELTEENPKVIALREKRAKILPLLQQKAEVSLGSNVSKSVADVQTLPYQNALRQDLSKQYVNASIQVRVLESKENSLRATSQALERQSEQLPALSRQYEDLQNRLKMSTEQLTKFVQKRRDLTIDAARQEVPWELVSPPTVAQISSISLLKNMAIGMPLGMILGFGVALLIDKMNNVIYTLKDLRSETRLPILGMIPRHKVVPESLLNAEKVTQEKPVLTPAGIEGSKFTSRPELHYQFSPFIEAFRSLYSQIRLLNPDSPIHSLVISSSSAGEGKTTIANQLAQAAAAMGKRVLIVNADLRKSSFQTLMSPNGCDGLTGVITGLSNLIDTIQPVCDRANLFTLPVGPIPLDPTSLLGSQKMLTLMEQCQDNFDLVIYDTAPLKFADALLLTPQADGLLMVTKLGETRRETLKATLQMLVTSQVPILGLAVNGVDDTQFDRGSSHR